MKKRRASESFGISADSKKLKQPSMKSKSSASATKSLQKRRPSPLKSSLKREPQNPKRVSHVVTFNQSVDYDEGARLDTSNSPTIPPPSYGNSVGGKLKDVQPEASLDEDSVGKSYAVHESDHHIPKSAEATSRFGILTRPPTLGIPKKNPMYSRSEPSLTAAPEKSGPARDNNPKRRTEYKAYPSLPEKDRIASGVKILEELAKNPRALTLEEASDALLIVRDLIRSFSTKHFEYDMTAEERHDWPLADLQDHNPELVASCAYVADGSQYGWRQLFTESYCRPRLVQGLLAHYLVEHVFKHTCFGLNDGELANLEDTVLKKYIHYDGFVRAKQLARAIGAILDTKAIEDRSFDRFMAVTALSTQILSTIKPLFHKGYIDVNAEIDLKAILSDAQALAISLRLTGANRTVLRFSFPSKHSKYQLSGGQNCLNVARVDATQHHAPDLDRDELRVKIPCWPTIIATVPSGPDMLDFKDDPTLKERAGKPLSTYIGAPEDNPGAFVTEVFLTPSDVYCEWTPLAAPLQPQLKLTLWQAIQQAKKERALATGQPWPSLDPWYRTATRTAGFVLGAAAVGGLAAAAVTACTPRGRSLLLETAKHVIGSVHRREDTDSDIDAVKRVIADAAASRADKESFFLIGKLRSMGASSLNNLSNRIRIRISKTTKTTVRQTGGSSKLQNPATVTLPPPPSGKVSDTTSLVPFLETVRSREGVTGTIKQAWQYLGWV